MERGVVKWFDPEKGYGFIETSNNEKKDYFVHQSNVEEGSLEKGQMVEFQIAEGQKGPHAVNVRVLVE